MWNFVKAGGGADREHHHKLGYDKAAATGPRASGANVFSPVPFGGRVGCFVMGVGGEWQQRYQPNSGHSGRARARCVGLQWSNLSWLLLACCASIHMMLAVGRFIRPLVAEEGNI